MSFLCQVRLFSSNWNLGQVSLLRLVWFSQVPQLTWKSVGCTIPKKHGTAADLPLRFWSLEAKDLFNFPTGFLMKWHLGGGSGKSAAEVEWLYLWTQWMNRSVSQSKISCWDTHLTNFYRLFPVRDQMKALEGSEVKFPCFLGIVHPTIFQRRGLGTLTTPWPKCPWRPKMAQITIIQSEVIVPRSTSKCIKLTQSTQKYLKVP